MAGESTQRVYGDGNNSSIGTQFNTQHWLRAALIEKQKDRFFTTYASVTDMPKNYGKKLVKYHYVPLLDDRNINDQGIDAAGVVISSTEYFVTLPAKVMTFATEALATAATTAINNVTSSAATKAASTPWTVTVTDTALAATTKTKANAVVAAIPKVKVRQGSGNLWGSSKDIGRITSKLPLIGEKGGRFNRVGYTRLKLEGTFEEFGMFHEFSKDSLQFDTDPELQMHISRTFVDAAVEIYEAVLQKDLIQNAATVRYPGTAALDGELSGNEGGVTELTYDVLMRLSIDLDETRTPKHTKVLTGTRLVDTVTIAGARALHCGSEMVPTFKYMKDPFDNPAFIPVHKYAANGDVLNGEIGAVDQFRIIQVPEMLNLGPVGAAVTTNKGYREEGGKYLVYPLLCIGAESFTTIGFETNGADSKFRTIFKPPGEAQADRNDPFGKTGFGSVAWWYGTLFLRKERLGLIKSVARI